jgi:FkbM family methyltransferase
MEHNHHAHKLWNFDKGDDTHRLNYPLTKDSFVWDVGGFEGGWSAKISNIYDCNIFVFEPVKEYYDALVHKFANTPKVKIFNFGLGASTMKCNMSPDGDGSKPKEEGSPVLIKSINEFIFEENITSVDLIKINIEGAEYGLMESLIDKNNIEVFNHYQIQFHVWETNCEERHKLILESINKTHDSTYSYPFIWEGFHKKLTSEQEKEIIEKYSKGAKFKELSIEYNHPILFIEILVGKNEIIKQEHLRLFRLSQEEFGPGFGSEGSYKESTK